MEERPPDSFEESAAGLDYDDSMRDRAASLGSAFATHGPEALFDEIENLLPDPWREQVVRFPLTAVGLAVGIGIFLGMRKGDEIIAAGSSLIAAAATSNLNQFLQSQGEPD
ncbi:MAG: hypothetical protein ACYC7A_01755 [Thermoanaerobaculia bacterium]